MANYRKKEARDWAWANMRGTRRAEYLAAALVVAVIAALWMNALWAYPLAIVILGAFTAYQAYWFSHTHSIATLLLTIVDTVLVYLTWLEWRVQETQRANRILMSRLGQ